MGEPRFTPGPWRLRTEGNIGNAIEAFCGRKGHEGDDGYRILASYNDATASNLYKNQAENRLANGHLIAAAPELYAALDAIERSTDYGMDDDRPLMRAARAALAKARGEVI